MADLNEFFKLKERFVKCNIFLYHNPISYFYQHKNIYISARLTVINTLITNRIKRKDLKFLNDALEILESDVIKGYRQYPDLKIHVKNLSNMLIKTNIIQNPKLRMNVGMVTDYICKDAIASTGAKLGQQIGEGGFGIINFLEKNRQKIRVLKRQELIGARDTFFTELFINNYLKSRFKNNILPEFIVDIEQYFICVDTSTNKLDEYGGIVMKIWHGSVEGYVIKDRQIVSREMAEHLLAIIQNIHSANVVHLDTGLRNFLYKKELINNTPTTVLGITDFGLSRTLDEIHSTDYVKETLKLYDIYMIYDDLMRLQQLHAVKPFIEYFNNYCDATDYAFDITSPDIQNFVNNFSIGSEISKYNFPLKINKLLLSINRLRQRNADARYLRDLFNQGKITNKADKRKFEKLFNLYRVESDNVLKLINYRKQLFELMNMRPPKFGEEREVIHAMPPKKEKEKVLVIPQKAPKAPKAPKEPKEPKEKGFVNELGPGAINANINKIINDLVQTYGLDPINYKGIKENCEVSHKPIDCLSRLYQHLTDLKDLMSTYFGPKV